MRVVIDTNVLVSSLINAGTPPAGVIQAWNNEVFELVTSRAQIDELTSVLGRARLQRFLRDAPFTRELIARIERHANVVQPTETLDLCDDPDDNRVLEAAVAGEADYIVMGDDDLLRLREVRGTRICTPAQFLAELTTLG